MFLLRQQAHVRRLEHLDHQHKGHNGRRLKQFVDRFTLPTPRGMLNQRGYRSTGFLARVRKQKNKISPEPDALKKPAIPFKKNVRPRD